MKTALIHTDASYFPDHHLGSFAFWIEYGNDIITLSGILKYASNSLEAEAMCICNALYTFLHHDFKDIDRIIIKTDSLHSINKIKYKDKKHMPFKIAQDLLKSIKQKHGNSYKFKHVKAHNGLNTNEKIINNWCDMEARKIGREYIKKQIQKY